MFKQIRQQNFLIENVATLKKQFNNLSFYLLASVLSSFIGIIINPLLAANLSPEDYAIIGYFTSFNLLILPVVSFSLLAYYTRNFFKIKEEDRQEVLDTLLISQLIIGLIGLAVFLFGFYLYIRFAKVKFEYYPFAVLCFVPVFFNCFFNFLLTEKRMKRKAVSYFKIATLNSISLAILAVILVAFLHKKSLGRFWSILLPSVFFGIYSFMKLITKFQFNKKIFLDAISFGWPISLSAILYYFLSGVDRAMLERLNETTTFGIYNIAIQISSYLFIFYTAISQTFEPDIYKNVAENKRKKLVIILIGILILNSIPTILFILFAYPIVNLLTYGRYVQSTGFARILAIKTIPMALCFYISNVIIAYGYPKIELINRLFGAILSIYLFHILIKNFGFYGAAWGQSIVFIVMSAISSLFIIYKLIYQLQKK
jgi:O-antigen/teichoic acid export membrane protein